MAAFDGMGTRVVRPADSADLEKLAERVAALEEALKAQQWRPTGSCTWSLNGSTTEWFRPSDGRRESYPSGFDPNVGAYVNVTLNSEPRHGL